jgi:hypothetical protein
MEDAQIGTDLRAPSGSRRPDTRSGYFLDLSLI